MRPLLLAAAAALAAVASEGSHAATITTMPQQHPDDMPIISISGMIVPPDAATLDAELKKIPAGQRFLVMLNSGGGDVAESFAMAARIKARGNVVAVVGPGLRCSGSCFVLFAAARFKVAEPTSELAVFTVQERSQGPGEDFPVTIEEVQLLKTMGVPDVVLWRLLRAPYGTSHNLTAAERTAMGIDQMPAEHNAARTGSADVPAPAASAGTPQNAPVQSRASAYLIAIILSVLGLGWLLREAPSPGKRRLWKAERAVAAAVAQRPLVLENRAP